MKRLLLLSLGLGAIKDFVRKSPSELLLAFVPTAGDPYEKPTFVDDDRRRLVDMGFQMREVDIKTKTAPELKEILLNVDVLYVAGGNSFYLLDKMRLSGLDGMLPELLDRGLLYVGASAGAVVIGPDLEPITTIDDPTKAPGLMCTKGLSIVPFVVLPHSGKEKYLPKYNAIVEKFKDRFELIPLTDQQAVVVENDQHKVISSE